MRFFILSLFILITSQFKAQDLYDLGTIQTIEINFSQSNWDAILDAQMAGAEDYTMAQTVTINGTVMDSVGVKYKGNSTYNPNQTKNPFHIELDTYKDQNYNGYKDIKLSNVAKDPSFLREVLSYYILRKYMHAPLSNYANVYVNGTLLGLYSNSEAITKTFLNDRFYANDSAFFKCNPPAGAGPGTNDYPDLVYLGQSETSYYDGYELKSDEGWDELIDLCDTLANHVDDIEKILDVDRALWMLAFNNVLVNLDSYSGGFKQNYYLYRDNSRRFSSIVWDLNESFGRFSMTGTINLNNTASKAQMTPLLHENDADWPLIQKLLSVPRYKKMYLAHCKTMLLENFDNGEYIEVAEMLMDVIDESVQADQYKFFTYANFISNINTDVNGGGGPGGGSTPGITALMNNRSNYLLGLSTFTQTQPTISNIMVSDDAPLVGETVTITAEITDENAVLLGHRNALDAAFTRIEMFDDGMHNDGAADDGIYGVSIPLENSYTQYYIYAENDNAGKFSPVRAEHEYYYITATLSDPVVGDLVINEFMASNNTAVSDQDGEFDDWIELHNNSDESIDLTGHYLSDNPNNLLKWEFPFGTTIDANGYLTVWADEDGSQNGYHANFKLSSTVESIFLVDSLSTIIDEVSYVNQSTDVSFGRYPNGTGNFTSMDETFNAENMLSTGIENISFGAKNFHIYPNPASSFFTIQLNEDAKSIQLVSVFSMDGKMIHQDVVKNNLLINVSDWAKGFYVIKVGRSYAKMIVQ